MTVRIRTLRRWRGRWMPVVAFKTVDPDGPGNLVSRD
tara:strand:- start:1133 stop:1243 length:111 start_codon:yes stop_codon:yes gene_type:complete